MKTTKKKGFTLIELIVVIAIIGVLAAILVPTMLGYVRKSKLSSANSTASSVYKAINSALTELDEEGIDIGADLILVYNPTTDTWATGTPAANTLAGVKNTTFKTKVANFFSDISKVKGGVQAAITNGSCYATAVASDSTYTGTYPTGVVTSDNYTTYKGSSQLQAALIKAADNAGYTLTAQGKSTKKGANSGNSGNSGNGGNGGDANRGG